MSGSRSPDALAAFNALVYGRVQGVYYRAYVTEHAQRLGLTGWVRNLRDTSVEVCAEGKRNQLEKFLIALKQGPPGARVDDIKVNWSEAPGKYSSFAISY